MKCNQTVRCQPDHNNVEHNFGQDCTELFTDCFQKKSAILIANFRSVQWRFFLFLHTCGTMTYSEVLAANFESGTWTHVRQQAVESGEPLTILVNQSIRTLRWRGTHGWTRTKQLRRSLSGQSISITWIPRIRTRKAFLMTRSRWSCWIWTELRLRRTCRMRR